MNAIPWNAYRYKLERTKHHVKDFIRNGMPLPQKVIVIIKCIGDHVVNNIIKGHTNWDNVIIETIAYRDSNITASSYNKHWSLCLET